MLKLSNQIFGGGIFLKKLSKHDSIFIGLTLFSMFFGAGNLIFPPFLGAQAGTTTFISMIGFTLSAICLPILGVITVAQSEGLPNLAGRVGKKFSFIFTLIIYLSIGPCLAIPRTDSTSFEMAVTPFTNSSPSIFITALYSFIFFLVAMIIAFHPEKLTDRLGKILGPCLLLLILVIVVGCIINSPGGYGNPTGDYSQNQLVQGFLDGYLTMDTIAALNFGIVISLNIKNKGVSDDNSIIKYTIRAGLIAGSILLIVYASLAHVGAVSGGSFPGADNGATVLTNIVSWLFGSVGAIILGLVFVIACLNTCIGLLSCCSQYFSTIFPNLLSYKKWVVLFSAASFFISIAGLNAILAVSVPVLNAIYPVSITLIVLGLTHKFIGRKFKLVYPFAIIFCGIFSVFESVISLFESPFLIKDIYYAYVPFADISLGWVIPAIIGAVIGIFLSGNSEKQLNKN